MKNNPVYISTAILQSTQHEGKYAVSCHIMFDGLESEDLYKIQKILNKETERTDFAVSIQSVQSVLLMLFPTNAARQQLQITIARMLLESSL